MASSGEFEGSAGAAHSPAAGEHAADELQQLPPTAQALVREVRRVDPAAARAVFARCAEIAAEARPRSGGVPGNPVGVEPENAERALTAVLDEVLGPLSADEASGSFSADERDPGTDGPSPRVAALSPRAALHYLVAPAAVELCAADHTADDTSHNAEARAEAVRIHTRAAQAQRARDEVTRIRARIAQTGRRVLSVDRERIAELEAAAARLEQFTPSANASAVAEEVARLRVCDAREQLERGLVLTRQMRQIVSEALPALLRGEPLLLIGETGGAKTALAQYLCAEYLPQRPAEIVSGYGDMTAAQLMGSFELRVTDGATESVFVEGPLPRAMRAGAPLIIDEINALPPEFLKRLNLVLQLRPGDRYAVQENQGRALTVAPGFVILATANEHTPTRYRGLERMSAELTNRFGANSYRVHYPDRGVAYDGDPVENTLLAFAAAIDDSGELPPDVTAEQLSRAARAAFISQQVFSGTQGEGFDRYLSEEDRIDGRPGLEETVLAPRTLVAVVQKAARSGGAVSVEHALLRFVESVMHPEDRAVLTTIIESQGFTLSEASTTA